MLSVLLTFQFPLDVCCVFTCVLPIVSGRKSSVWLCVWHECHRLPRDSRLTKLDELFRGVLRLRGKCAGLLPAPHGHAVHLRHLPFTAVSVCVR